MAFRGKWFMHHPLQAKYLLLVLFSMLAPTILIGYCFYSILFQLMAKQLVFPEAIYANLVPVIGRVNSLLIIALPVLALVILWFALVLSHRFAGPVERIESDLDQMIAGDLKHRVRLRKNDDLRGIAEKINVLVKRLQP